MRTLEETAAAAGVSLDAIESVAPAESGALDAYAALYVEGRPKANERVAKRLLGKPLFYAAMAVKAGDADALVAGASQPTARVIEAGLMSVGLAQGIATPSSFFIMVPRGDGEPLVFADCAVNVEPDGHRDAVELLHHAVADARASRSCFRRLRPGQRSTSTPEGRGARRAASPSRRPGAPSGCLASHGAKWAMLGSRSPGPWQRECTNGWIRSAAPWRS